MYCPRCGQRQLSEQVRFCSRCGFPLGGVASLLESGGETGAGRRGLSPRQIGMRKGLTWMAGALVFGLCVPLIALGQADLLVLFFPAAVFFMVGFIRMLYGLLLEDNTSPAQLRAARASATLEDARPAELPPAHSIPASDFVTSSAATAEMVTPPSVAEGTTKILKEGADG